MISPKDFQDIFLPPLVETMQRADNRVYHLDGKGALHQLDTLLSLPELHAIQWIPGSGHEEILQWIPLIRKIQDAGKAIVVYTEPDKVIPLIKEVPSEGLCISTCCSDEEKARKLVESVDKMF